MSAHTAPLTQEQAAALADVTPRHLRRLTAEGKGPSPSAAGEYEPRAFGAWLRSRTSDDKSRLLRAQAAMAELDLAERRGETITVDVMVPYMAAIYTRTRARLLALPSAVAPLVAEPGRVAEVQEILRERVYEVLTELAGDVVPPEVRKRREKAAQSESA
jgi:hypothetical protein